MNGYIDEWISLSLSFSHAHNNINKSYLSSVKVKLKKLLFFKTFFYLDLDLDM